MSLFGQSQSNSGPGASSGPAPSGGGLFGGGNTSNLAANSKPAFSFGSTPAQSQPQQQPQQPQPQPQAPAQGSSLFGQSNPAPNAGASSNTGFKLGGNTTPSGPTPTNGTTTSAATTLASGSGTGSTTIPRSTVATSINSTSRLLKDLIESANNLPKLDNHDLGSIHLTLNELQRKSDELRKHKDDKSNFTRAHYLLASSGISAEEIENDLKSIDLPVDRQGHQSMNLNKIVKPKHVGIDQFLNTKKEENILTTIEQSLAAASSDFDAYINKTISIDWKVKRNELRKSIVNQTINKPSKPSDNVKNEPSVPAITWNRSVPGNYSLLSALTDSTANGGSTSSSRQYSRDKFEKHATIIYHLNESRSSNHYYPLLSSFEEINKSNADLKSKQITDVYKILIKLTDEENSKVSQEQKFFNKYQLDDSKPLPKEDGYKEDKVKLNELIIKKSKNYLQEQFYQYMDEIYSKEENKQDFLPANNTNKVKFFIHKIVMKNNADFDNTTLKINGTSIWALIYFLLRAGLTSEVLQLVSSNSEVFAKFDKNFPLYVRKYLEHDTFKLPPELNDRLVQEFNQQFSFINEDFKNSFDPYKYSVYKIIGKCDLSRKNLPPSINLSIEDWLWFHLSIINESNNVSDLIYENYSLKNLQKQIIQLGSRKLNSSSNNPMYLKCLIMVGLYELAIQYTYEFLNEIDAVHLAIGLNYYGLLKVSSSFSKDELISLNPHGNDYEINFLRLVGSFTRTFKISDPKVACQYLILIAISKGGDSKEEITKCHEAIRELILVSREFNLLLGHLNDDNGEKTSGLLENQRSLIKLSNLNDFYSQIVELSAKKCEEEGRVFDALLLYQVCQEYDTVLMIINRILSELITTTELDKSLVKSGNYEADTDSSDPNKDTIDNNIVLLSKHILNTFNNNSSILTKVKKSLKNTCDLLVSIISIRESFLLKNFNQVVLDIENLNLLPINVREDLFDIRKKADYVQNALDNSILKIIPSLLIIVMTSVCQLNYQILTKSFKALNNESDELLKFKTIAKNCMIFAGIIQYKMPRETYSLLIQLESQL